LAVKWAEHVWTYVDCAILITYIYLFSDKVLENIYFDRGGQSMSGQSAFFLPPRVLATYKLQTLHSFSPLYTPWPGALFFTSLHAMAWCTLFHLYTRHGLVHSFSAIYTTWPGALLFTSLRAMAWCTLFHLSTRHGLVHSFSPLYTPWPGALVLSSLYTPWPGALFFTSLRAMAWCTLFHLSTRHGLAHSFWALSIRHGQVVYLFSGFKHGRGEIFARIQSSGIMIERRGVELTEILLLFPNKYFRKNSIGRLCMYCARRRFP
jgi:hypothetical protein